ncbi:MAG: hybrid sensor histidine kinase/response regulator [Deltaproteobacteria bacterium]|nr:hybrid sensor histidine kinase/response regulator [Deltaproteobacteria bacterium]
MAQATVLIVEDEPEVGDLLEYNLERHGFTPLRAADGLTACRVIGSEHPDLVLLDLMLPDLDGREICRLVRANKDQRVSGTPILMLTALASAEDRVGGLALGADDYVAKPFAVEEIVLRVRKLIDRTRAEKASAARAEAALKREAFLLDLQDMLFHELKNHLLVVSGFSGRLHEHGHLLDPEKRRSYSGAIHRSSRYLFGMAEDMLLLRRIERGDLELPDDCISPRDLVAPVAELFATALSERGSRLHLDLPPGLPNLRVNAPSAKIVLSSLLDNAVKYGRDGGTVELSCRPSDARNLSIRVADDGLGIPEEEIPHIFEKFFRGGKETLLKNGTGLGLYFAKTLTEAMGGSIGVRSVVGEGAEFEIRLPLDEL